MPSSFFSGARLPLRALGPGTNTGTRPKINSLAVVAAVCAALGFVTAIGFLAAIVVGHVALAQIRRSNGYESGRRLALAAVIVGWVPVVLVALAFGLLVIVGFLTAMHQ